MLCQLCLPLLSLFFFFHAMPPPRLQRCTKISYAILPPPLPDAAFAAAFDFRYP